MRRANVAADERAQRAPQAEGGEGLATGATAAPSVASASARVPSPGPIGVMAFHIRRPKAIAGGSCNGGCDGNGGPPVAHSQDMQAVSEAAAQQVLRPRRTGMPKATGAPPPWGFGPELPGRDPDGETLQP